jgi:HSP20 family protein
LLNSTHNIRPEGDTNRSQTNKTNKTKRRNDLMTLTLWNPIRDLAGLEIEGLNRMFEGHTGEREAWVPSIDVYETPGKDLVVKADLPELKREDIKVTFENDVLTIAGERPLAPAVSRDHYHRLERGHGSFTRSFTLPTTVDGSRVSAAYQDGVLTVTLPRREEARPRQIQVNG